MEEIKQNKMAVEPLKKLFWKMGLPMIVSMVLQSLRYAFKPFLTALLRLAVFMLPIAYMFTLSPNVVNIVWWAFPISELLTAIISFFILNGVVKKKIDTL